MHAALFKVCSRAVDAKPQKPGEARAFFEQNFRPVRISPLGDADGFVTGYYEPIVEGTRSKSDGYDYPLYRKPAKPFAGRPNGGGRRSGRRDGKKKGGRKRRKLVPSTTAPRSTTACWPGAISKSAG